MGGGRSWWSVLTCWSDMRADLPSLNLLLAQTLNHLIAQIIYRLHLSGLQSQLAHLGTLTEKQQTTESFSFLTAKTMFCWFKVATHVLKYGHYFPKSQQRMELMDVRHKAPVLWEPTVPVAGLSIWISTTSPSIISVSSLLVTQSLAKEPTAHHSRRLLARLLDPHSDGLPEGLAERLSLAHLQREDLTPGQSCEGCVGAKRLSNACINKKTIRLRRRKNIFFLDIQNNFINWERDCTRMCQATVSPIAMAVFPVPGWPAISTALLAMRPSLIISRMTPAARREASWPTIPWDTCRGSGQNI